jgi:translocator assembly and maintenance protein 41
MDGVLTGEGFPPVLHAVAYGSGAVPQAGYASRDIPMLDLILVVDDAEQWHRSNLSENPHHYSGVRHLGASAVSLLQKMPAGVYYNTLIAMKGPSQKGRLMKYGVVCLHDLVDDLTSWRYLYLAGRFHKPLIHLTILGAHTKLRAAVEQNLQSAVRASLLLLPEKFSRTDLFIQIAGLSYSGDFRMVFGENPDKVRNIVLPNAERFAELYDPFIASDFPSLLSVVGDAFAQDTAPLERARQVALLPSSLRGDPILLRRIRRIVFRSSLIQSAKGVVSAGPIKSGRYAGAKILKWASWWGNRLLR